MEGSQSAAKPTTAETCFDKTFSTLTVHDVYEIAKLVGAEVERLIDGYGKDSAVGLVPKIVKVLELLESYASWNQTHKQQEEELLKTFETIQLQQNKKRLSKDEEIKQQRVQAEQEKQQQQEEWQKRCEELQIQVQQLQEDREELCSRLKGSYAKEDRVQRQEREVMLKLKSVVDKQRDELRAKVQEISSVSKEVEALQEQLDRFMKMNAELRHKQNVMQVQLKSTVERKADMEADLKEKTKEIQNLLAQLNRTNNSQSSPRPQACDPSEDQTDPDRPCFTKKEVRDIIVERNELKTNLFLLQEELSYYQREILNEDRCPGFLLEAVRSAIKKKRKLIKAKMLGIPVNECSNSDDEDRNSASERTEVDGAVNNDSDKPAESRIRNLFGFLTRSGSSTHMSSSASAWEIIEDAECEEDATDIRTVRT